MVTADCLVIVKQIMVKVKEADCYIAWEFDVIVGEVLFCLLRAKSSDSSTASAAKVTMVMEPQNYHEGEAIQVSQYIYCCHRNMLNVVQGSFECKAAGTYFLQWTVTSTSPISPGGKSRNRATIMHYQEVIGCEEFK